MIRRFTIRSSAGSFALLIAAAIAVATGCASGPDPLGENSGRVLNTAPDEQLTPEMFYGKWDLDGDRTNTANGRTGIESVGSDVMKDLTGKGWRLAANGVMHTDKAVGTSLGRWRIDGRNTLIVKESADAIEQTYQASFVDGYLYLHRADGIYLVFERDKFFGA